MPGQIDAPPAMMEAKITLERARDDLTEAVLELIKAIGDPSVNNVEHISADSSRGLTTEIPSQAQGRNGGANRRLWGNNDNSAQSRNR